jgi:acetolactate synthase I/II/III large subunit
LPTSHPSEAAAERRPVITIAAEAIAQELKALGIRHFFLVTGGDNSLWIALRRQGIAQVLARSEASAVYMADAYARVTGMPTFVYGQYGPGAGNLAGALPEPLWSSSPVVAMPTSMRRQHRHGGEYQELEQIHVFAGVTKWQAEAQLPERMPHLVRAGALRAVAVPPGPVYIGMPSEALELEVPGYQPPAPDAAPVRIPAQRPRPAADRLSQALELIAGADRPVLLAGNGVHLSRAYGALQEVVETLELPVATSLSGKGAIAETHRLSIGTVGRYSRNYANALVRDADLILAVGSRLGGLVTDSYRLFAAGVKVVHVDADPSALGINFPTDVGIHADARSFLEDLATAGGEGRAPSRTAWLDRVMEERRSWHDRRDELARKDGTDGTMRPEAVLAAIDELAADDTLFLADTGYAAAWAGALIELKRAGQGYLRADGSLGWSFPAGLGAKLAAPDRPVIVITGDGGFGYHLSEIETALRLGLPIVVVILDNQTLAFEVHVQELLYKEVVEEVDDFVDVDYGAVARAFGAKGVRVRTASEFRDAFRDALHSDRLTVIDAIIAREAIGPVTRYDQVREREL